MKTSEFYIYEEYVSSVEGKLERRFNVHSVHGESSIQVRFVEDIAEKVKGLFCKVGDVYLLDKTVFYYSLNNYVKGWHQKPHIEVTREGTVVRGASSRSDFLHELNKEILDVLKEIKES